MSPYTSYEKQILTNHGYFNYTSHYQSDLIKIARNLFNILHTKLNSPPTNPDSMESIFKNYLLVDPIHQTYHPVYLKVIQILGRLTFTQQFHEKFALCVARHILHTYWNQISSSVGKSSAHPPGSP